MDIQMERHIDEYTYRWMDLKMNGRTDGWMDIRMGLMVIQLDGHTDGWMDIKMG